MSSALQCLFHTEELVHYFFSQKYKNDLYNFNLDTNLLNCSNNSTNNNRNLTNNFNNNDYFSNEINIDIETNSNYINFSLEKEEILEVRLKSNKESNREELINTNKKIDDIDIFKNIQNVEICKDNYLKEKFNLNGLKNNRSFNNIKGNYFYQINPNNSNKIRSSSYNDFRKDMFLNEDKKENKDELSNEEKYENFEIISDNRKKHNIELNESKDNKNSEYKDLGHSYKCTTYENQKENLINNQIKENIEEFEKEDENNINNHMTGKNDFSLIYLENYKSNITPSENFNNVYNENNENINNKIENKNKRKNSEIRKKSNNQSNKTINSTPIHLLQEDEREKQLILFTQNFKDLIHKMWSKGVDLINPKEFRESLICLNSQFNNYCQQDAHELLTFILESLHLKLNRGQANSIKEQNGNLYDIMMQEGSPFNLNLNKTQSILNWENHAYFNNSIINDHFYGLLLSSLTCKKCKNTNLTYEPFNHLGLSIPNEFHLFIYFIPNFEKNFLFSLKESKNEMNNNNITDYFMSSNGDNEIENESSSEKRNFNHHRYSKRIPKAIKMYIKINDNMQFKNIIDTISDKLNYKIDNAIFYSVLDNKVTRIIENDERCGELMQRNFFLFLAESNCEDKLIENYKNNNSCIPYNNEDIENNRTMQGSDDCENKIDLNYNISYKNYPFFVIYNFFSFNKRKFYPKLNSYEIGYPKLLNYLINSDPRFLFFILQDLIEKIEIIFHSTREQEKNIEFDNFESKRKNKISFSKQKINKKYNIDFKPNENKFILEISLMKNFIFCNKAVLLEETNHFFTSENTQEKFFEIIFEEHDSSERNHSRIKSNLIKNIKINKDKLRIQREQTIKNKFICLFCSSTDNDFFHCDCINEFIINNQNYFYLYKKSLLHFSNEEKKNYFSLLNFQNLNFGRIKKNFFENFSNYCKDHESSKKISTEIYTEINIFVTEEIIKNNIRKINACKDLTKFDQKENVLTLYDLLHYFTAEEKLREEKFFCNICNEFISRIKKLEINKFPNILIINFKRFRYDIIQSKSRNTRRSGENTINNYIIYYSNNNLNFGGEKNENKIDFPFELDLTKFNRYGEKTQYELYAVCNHEGKITGGHYKAMCKDFQSDKWFEFDDKIVKQINENNIVTHKAYILFYRRKRN